MGIALPTRDISLTRTALLNLLRALVAQGDLEQARVRIDEAYALSDRFTTLGEEQALAEARLAVALMAGELGTALDATPALLDVSRRAGELYRAMSGLMAPVEPWLLLDSQRDAAAALIDEAEARTAAGRIDELSQLVAVRRAELTLWRGDAAGALARIDPVLGHPALRAQDRHHALRVQALARHRIGLASTLDIPGPDMNPEPATLIHAARLMLEPTTVDAALEWFESGRATPLEALHLALALHARRCRSAGAPTTSAWPTRRARWPRACTTSLAGHAERAGRLPAPVRPPVLRVAQRHARPPLRRSRNAAATPAPARYRHGLTHGPVRSGPCPPTPTPAARRCRTTGCGSIRSGPTTPGRPSCGSSPRRSTPPR